MGIGMGTGQVCRGTGRESSWKILPLTENSDVPRVYTVKSVKQGRDCLLVIMLRVRKQSLSLCHLIYFTHINICNGTSSQSKEGKLAWYRLRPELMSRSERRTRHLNPRV